MDQGYNLEAAEQAEKAIKRLNVFKLAVEYLYHKDQYDSDETNFAKDTESAWPQLSDLQRDIVYMHTIQQTLKAYHLKLHPKPSIAPVNTSRPFKSL